MQEQPRRPDTPQPPADPDIVNIPSPDLNPAPPPDVPSQPSETPEPQGEPSPRR
jgi:hypothetical protein